MLALLLMNFGSAGGCLVVSHFEREISLYLYLRYLDLRGHNDIQFASSRRLVSLMPSWARMLLRSVTKSPAAAVFAGFVLTPADA